MDSTRIGAVVIGRNEGERLKRCIPSIQRWLQRIVYVDSDSTDGSAAYAVAAGVELVKLDLSVPFTAARARNVGWRRLMELDSKVQYIQFVDGDCELVDGWLDAAAQFLDEHPDVAVVCGRCREIDADRNLYHRLADREWNTPVGRAKYCGGNAMMQVAALNEVGGFRDSLIAGEEPELCIRFQSAGWQVWRIDREMVLHDVRMTSFRQWWTRSVRCGHAYAEGAALHGISPARHWVRESASVWFWGALLPLLSLVLAVPTRGVSLAVVAAAYLVLLIKTFSVEVAHQARMADSAQYAAMCVLAKFPQAIGQAMYWVNRARGKTRPIVEHRDSILRGEARHS